MKEKAVKSCPTNFLQLLKKMMAGLSLIAQKFLNGQGHTKKNACKACQMR